MKIILSILTTFLVIASNAFAQVGIESETFVYSKKCGAELQLEKYSNKRVEFKGKRSMYNLFSRRNEKSCSNVF